MQICRPRDFAMKVLISRKAPPKTLNETGGGRNLAIEMLLPLLLLNLQRKARAEYSLNFEWVCEVYCHKENGKAVNL